MNFGGILEMRPDVLRTIDRNWFTTNSELHLSCRIGFREVRTARHNLGRFCSSAEIERRSEMFLAEVDAEFRQVCEDRDW